MFDPVVTSEISSDAQKTLRPRASVLLIGNPKTEEVFKESVSYLALLLSVRWYSKFKFKAISRANAAGSWKEKLSFLVSDVVLIEALVACPRPRKLLSLKLATRPTPLEEL